MLQKILMFLVGLLIIIGIFYASVFTNYFQDYFEMRKMNIPIEKSLIDDWNIKLADNIISTPIIEGNQLILQTRSSIQSYDILTRQNLWKLMIRGNSRNCPPEITEEFIFTPNDDGIFAVDSNTGKIIWQSQLMDRDLIEDIKISSNRVFVATHNGYLYSLDINDGRVIWKTPVESRSKLRIFINNSNVTLNSSSFLSTYSQNTGEEIWKKKIRLENGILLNGQNVLIGLNYDSVPSKLIGIALTDGNELISNSIQVQNVNCIVETKSGLLIAGEGLALYNLADNKFLWENYKISSLNCPVVFENYVYVKKDLRDIYKYDILTGILQNRLPVSWESNSGSSYSIVPIVFRKWMIIETGSRKLVFFRQ